MSASPVVFESNTYCTFRLCMDYRKLNAVTCQDLGPIPRMEDSIDPFDEPICFILDAGSGNWQIDISDVVRETTAFVSPHGRCQLIYIPSALEHATSTYHRAMDDILSMDKWLLLLVYLDEIMTFPKSTEPNIKHV